MKINQSIIAAFLISLIVGALIMGVFDSQQYKVKSNTQQKFQKKTIQNDKKA